MTNANKLRQLARNYHELNQAAAEARQELDQHIQYLKRQGWGYRELAAGSDLAQGTIQKIIANDPQAYQYWRKRCTRKASGNNYCDVVWLKNVDEWCEFCRHGKEIEDSLYNWRDEQPSTQ